MIRRAAIIGLAFVAVGALVLTLRPHGSLSVDDLLPSSGPQPIGPPELVPLPQGWRYVNSRLEVPPAAPAAAVRFLYSSRMGQFEDHGSWGLLKEYHFDDHTDKRRGKIWHPGITVLVRGQ